MQGFFYPIHALFMWYLKLSGKIKKVVEIKLLEVDLGDMYPTSQCYSYGNSQKIIFTTFGGYSPRKPIKKHGAKSVVDITHENSIGNALEYPQVRILQTKSWC